jgi:lipoprotein-anchoring transpeptidase ErfK/SrfK
MKRSTHLLGVALIIGTALALSACQTLQVQSLDHTRPFPYAAWLAAEERLIASPTPYHWEDSPQAHLIEKPARRATGVSDEQRALGGTIHSPSNPTGPRMIYVDLSGQKAYVVNGDWIQAITRISSGRKTFPTPAGSYKVSQKVVNHRSNLYGDFVDSSGKVVKADIDSRIDKAPEGATYRGASMPHFLRLRESNNRVHGVGLHAGVLPGYAASHGCIRLPAEMARWLFQNTPEGTPVKIIKEYPLPAPPPAQATMVSVKKAAADTTAYLN